MQYVDVLQIPALGRLLVAAAIQKSTFPGNS